MTSLCFIVESGTDVRLVEGLAGRFNLSILARRILGGVEVTHPPTMIVPTLVGPSSRIKFAWFVFQYLRRHRREIERVLVQGYGITALAANLCGRIYGMPVAMLVCNPAEKYYRCRSAQGAKPFRRHELWALQLMARLNALFGRHYITLSEHLAGVVRANHSSAKISVVPVYGVDTSVFTPPRATKAEMKKRLGLPESGALIFFSSRIAPEKDSETLLQAFRHLLDDGHDLWLLHRSGGYQSFIKEAERFGVAARVIATSAVHPHLELPQDHQASDLCVQASREEGLGFSPLEALACGVPVVAAAVGGLTETIIDGETGWSYPVGDSQALAKRIAEALHNPLEAVRRAERGRALVHSRFDNKIVFEQLEHALVRRETSALTEAATIH